MEQEFVINQMSGFSDVTTLTRTQAVACLLLVLPEGTSQAQWVYDQRGVINNGASICVRWVT